MSYHEDQMYERSIQGEWSEEQLSEMISAAIVNYAREDPDGVMKFVFKRISQTEEDNINLKDDLDSIKDQLNDLNMETDKISGLVENVMEDEIEREERVNNLMESHVNSSLNVGQLGILFKELAIEKITVCTKEKIGHGVHLLAGVGAESFRKALGKNRPTSDGKELSAKAYYKNLKAVLRKLEIIVKRLEEEKENISNSISIEGKE
jgi:hypothetical protein